MHAVLVALMAGSAAALHEITGPDFMVPLNDTFVPGHADLPRLDFNSLTAPRVVELFAVPAAVQALYDAAGVQFLAVTYDASLPLSTATEEASFAGSQRLAACPRRLTVDDDLGDSGPRGPFLAANGMTIGNLASGASSAGFSGYNIKFVESARQLQFSVMDSAGTEDIVVRTYLTSTDENGDEIRVLQEELLVPTHCEVDPTDPRVCAQNGRGIDGRGGFIACIQADESCFDEVEILRASASSGEPAEAGFCIDDIMLGAIQHGRRFSLVTDEIGTRKQCGRSATLAKGNTLISRFISVSSAADAEWESIGLNHPAVLDNGQLDTDTFVVSVVQFGQLGEDFSNPDRVALQEGKKAFRFWPNPAARDTFFEITAFWLSDSNPAPASIDAGGHWHPSTLCEPGCGGLGYEQHHAYSAADRQGFTVEFIVNGTDVNHGATSLVDDAGHAEFQLAYFDYRNVGGHPDESDYPVLLNGHPAAPHHDAGQGLRSYAPLEVCSGPDVAHSYTSLAQWLACDGGDFRSYGADTYLPASHLVGGVGSAVPSIDSLGCCGRVVFGCVFLGSDEATVHACLWYEITSQANATRESIWDNFEQLGALVGTESGDLIEVIKQSGDAVRQEIAEWADNLTQTIGTQANETRMAIWEHFEEMGVQLLEQAASAHKTISDNGNRTADAIWEEANATRVNFEPKADRVWQLVNQTLDDLLRDTEVVNWAVPIINKATADTAENIRLLLELIDLLDNLPSDIDAHTMLVVEIAEKEVLVRLLQLKARLASMDGERKAALDEIKACMTVNRIRLEKTVDFARRLSDTSSESSS